jgi:hypothetical protein
MLIMSDVKPVSLTLVAYLSYDLIMFGRFKKFRCFKLKLLLLYLPADKSF